NAVSGTDGYKTYITTNSPLGTRVGGGGRQEPGREAAGRGHDKSVPTNVYGCYERKRSAYGWGI
ncbi:MAG: hypothetical protein JOZ18_14275, partial [Chloroflexi bacterium]|nr:hypothetical protein [Chloroflexota bacterium]